MQRTHVSVLAALLVAIVFASWAQAEDGSDTSDPSLDCFEEDCEYSWDWCDSTCIWFGADYQLLFPSRQNVPVLLRTPGGAPLAGDSPDLGDSNGVRINAGFWLCSDELAIQGIFFGTERSDVTNNQAAGVIPLSAPVGATPVTNFSYESQHQIGGIEGNALYLLRSNGATKFYALAGARYLELDEDIAMRYTTGGGNFSDGFHTRNEFTGGQIGGMVTHHRGRLELDVTTKVALGNNYTELFIQGRNNIGAAAQGFTGNSNIGFYHDNLFGVIPEANVNVSYRLTDRLLVNAGYMFLWSTNNWRPGDQITLNHNGGVTQPSVSPPAESSYFLHGLNCGLTFCF